jgi:hypothetical protein
MRRRFVVSVAVLFTAAMMVMLAPDSGLAQGELPQPPKGFQPPPPPPPAPVTPYKPVAVTLPGPYSDPSFVAFRKDLAAAAQAKDRAALAKLVVDQGFFWVQDKDIADPKKSGIDNLAKAIGLDSPEGSGWDILSADAADDTLAEVPQNQGLFCAPAPPTFDPAAFQTLLGQTDTDPGDWGYPASDGVEVRAAAQPNAQVIEKLGMFFVRVLPETGQTPQGAPPFLHLALPDGKTGFVTVDAVAPLASDQICYTKDAGAWKITGYIGGVSP